ncbi:MAG TPA: hypothetical protein DGR15_11725 [Methylophilus sp.]|nr:hypothetical protein [Methylophilus sp.]
MIQAQAFSCAFLLISIPASTNLVPMKKDFCGKYRQHHVVQKDNCRKCLYYSVDSIVKLFLTQPF